MVLVQSYRRNPAPNRPNPARITGMSLAIAFNAAGLLAMTVLMRPELVMPDRNTGMVVVPIQKKIEKTPEPPPVVKVEQRRDPVQPQPRPAQPRPAATPQSASQPLATGPVAAATPDAFSLPPTAGTPDPAPPAGPVAGVRLEYASAPAPLYTAALIRERAEGTVTLRVLVDVDGRPLQVDIHKSSGNHRLDRLAQQHVLKQWTFRPATKDGHAIQAIGLVPIDFKLQ